MTREPTSTLVRQVLAQLRPMAQFFGTRIPALRERFGDQICEFGSRPRRYDCSVHTNPHEEALVARRTVYLPDSVDGLVRRMARKDESYSATLARLIEAATEALQGRRPPSYVGTGDGPEDLGRLAERYLRRLVSARSNPREPGARRARGSG